MKLIECILIIATFGFALGVKKMIIPSITICKRYDPQLSACVMKNFKLLLPVMRNGIPEMNIAPLDPVHLEIVRMEFPPTKSIALTTALSDMMIWGISDSSVNKGIATHKNGTLDMLLDMTIHRMKIESDYKALGKLLFLSIDAFGKFSAKLDDVHMVMKWKSTPFIKKGNTHIKWDCEVEKLIIGKMQVYHENLFGNNTELTENTNKVINENIDELFKEIRPVIKETIKSIVLNVVNNVYDLFPFDLLFPVD